MSTFSSSLCDSLYARNFQQIVLEPTHIHCNVLDLVLTTNTDRLQNLSITNSFKSDHLIIQFNILSNSSLRYTNTSGSVYNYAKGDYSGMNFYLMEMHFDTTSFNAEHLWTSLKSALLDGCSLFAPIYHPKEKVEAFNKFFNSTFTISDLVLPPQHRMPTPSNQLSQITVSESDVFEALVSLNPNKAQGCVNIKSHILKYCCTSLTSPVTHLFSTCMNQSILPQEWEVRKMFPVPKKGDLSKITNYRPISLLCVLSKVLESIIYAKIIPFIYPQLNKSQFGFLQDRSCLTQLLSSFSQIYDSIENKNQCMLFTLISGMPLTLYPIVNYSLNFGVLRLQDHFGFGLNTI